MKYEKSLRKTLVLS